MHWSNIGTSLKVSLRYKFGFCIAITKNHFHFLTTVESATPPPTFCFSDGEMEMTVRKWLRLISPTSTAKFLNSCQDGKKSISVVGDYVGKK
jgi:hypothetical protein